MAELTESDREALVLRIRRTGSIDDAYALLRAHDARIAAKAADEREAGVRARVEAVLPGCYLQADPFTCLDITDERWAEEMRCVPCKIRAALAQTEVSRPCRD